MIPKPAQYLLRLDDLCPTHSPSRWERFRKVIEEFGIRPILAVIPDNHDLQLNSSPYDPRFWEQMREMEAAGAAIAVHGYQHRCQALGESLLGMDRRSEFAGVDPDTQRAWIHSGFEILRGKGLHPRLWIAPRHGFDRNTLGALVAEGVEYISDGFARAPHRRYGVIWIPQQLWAPMAKSKGLWTICIHPHAAEDLDVERLRWFLKDHWPQFTSFDRVVQEFKGQSLGSGERIYERLALWRVQRRRRRPRQGRRPGWAAVKSEED
jgi:predicted deacetylase